MNALTRLEQHGDIAVLLINNPPVNALSPAVIQGLSDALDMVEANTRFRALLICCEGLSSLAVIFAPSNIQTFLPGLSTGFLLALKPSVAWWWLHCTAPYLAAGLNWPWLAITD